jgi:hypothetical protein
VSYSPDEEAILREAIDVFYKASGFHGWHHDVNDAVAQVFMVMLCEARKCSTAMSWVPRPPAGPATVGWLARQIGRAGIERLRATRLSIPCGKMVVARWGRILDSAARSGMAMGLVPCE